MSVSADEQRVREIEREHRIANATRRTETDSWLNGYMDDVGFLLALVTATEAAVREAAELREALSYYATPGVSRDDGARARAALRAYR